MAIKVITNYSKRLGLPGYSSHQFSVSIETEISATGDIPAEAARLYQLLQSSVDTEIQATGFVPPWDYGLDKTTSTQPATAPSNGRPASHTESRPHAKAQAQAPNTSKPQRGPAWRCSARQRDLILKLIEEHKLDKNNIEALAIERFGKGVRALNKVEASGLIDEMLDTYGSGNRQTDSRHNGNAYGGTNGRREAA